MKTSKNKIGVSLIVMTFVVSGLLSSIGIALASVDYAVVAPSKNITTPVTKVESKNMVAFKFMSMMKNGSKGNEVMELQKSLSLKGYYTGKDDGKFGPKTKASLAKFQVANGLKGDGVVGPMTRTFLNK